MLKRTILSLAAAAALACGALAPPRASAQALDANATAKTVAAPTLETPAAATPAPSGEKEGNAFLRAITAPFRALAKLFGGGDGHKSDRAARNRKNSRRNTAKTKEQTTPAPVVVSTEPNVTPEPAAELRARVTPLPPPELWKPYIEGVPMDHLSQGRALLQFGYFGEAIAELTLAATVGPDLVEANNLLGQAHDKVGAHEQARQYYERALDLAPQNPWVRHNLGYSYFLDDQYEAALKHLRQAERGAPTDARIANNVGLVQFRLHKFDDALKTFARLEGEYAARVKLADMLERAGWDGEAVKHYEAALRLQPNSLVALERLAELYQRAGRPAQAEAMRRTLRNLSHAGGG
jgi:Flp pilus assembly protein TadD